MQAAHACLLGNDNYVMLSMSMTQAAFKALRAVLHGSFLQAGARACFKIQSDFVCCNYLQGLIRTHL